MLKKLNILSLTQSLSGGGAEKIAISVSSELKNNNNVKLYILKNKIDFNISMHDFDLIVPNYKNRIFIILELIKYINTSRLDVIISFTRMTNIYLGFIKPFISKEIKLVGFKQTLLNEIYSFKFIKRHIFLKIYKITMKNIDLLIVNSIDTKNNIYREKIIPKNFIILPNPAIDNNYEFQETLPVSHRFLTDKNFTFVMVGRLVPQKGYFTALKIFEKSLKTNPDYRLLVLGTGPLLKD